MTKADRKPQPTDYISRELSWLEFNQRVLQEARISTSPLLERLKFLAITASNLDEFFKVRVGGLKILDQASPGKQDITGRTADEQLREIETRVRQFYEDQYDALLNEIEPKLRAHEICRHRLDELKPEHLEHLRLRFEEEFGAVVSPIMIDGEESLPLFSNAALCICVRLKFAADHALADPEIANGDQLGERFAILPIAKQLDRFISVPSSHGYHYVPVETVLKHFVQEFFPGQTILECIAFRVTRNADMSLDEDGASDLLLGMTELLVDRRTSECVRLEIADSASQEIQQFLVKALNVSQREVYLCRGPLDLGRFMALAMLPGFEMLRAADWPALQSPEFPVGSDIFETIASKDLILVHPYESYDPVVHFLQSAAQDPHVIAIKQILYRTSNASAMVKALGDAAANGKSVTAIVELKARFDEERNIKWAKQLEQSGVDVIYGVRGLKTHAKNCTVVRREPQGIRRYLHFGTGNYNESTARIYSDISFFTCDQQLGDEAINIFNAITGLSVPRPTTKLAFSPIDLRTRIEEMIEIETANALAGKPAKIEAKINSLSDQRLIDLLYRASQAGVPIELNVRGICCLRPGIPGLSENIRVISIVDRFLEHARIFYFQHDGDHRAFISSADWMGRNLDRRVELLIPIENHDCRLRVLKTLEFYFRDNVNAHELQTDGSYKRLSPGDEPVFRSQEKLYEECRDLHSAMRHHQTTLFEPHRADNS